MIAKSMKLCAVECRRPDFLSELSACLVDTPAHASGRVTLLLLVATILSTLGHIGSDWT